MNSSDREKKSMVSKPPMNSRPRCTQRAFCRENSSLRLCRGRLNQREASCGAMETRAKMTKSLALTAMSAAAQQTTCMERFIARQMESK